MSSILLILEMNIRRYDCFMPDGKKKKEVNRQTATRHELIIANCLKGD